MPSHASLDRYQQGSHCCHQSTQTTHIWILDQASSQVIFFSLKSLLLVFFGPSYVSVGLFTCPRFGEKELITRAFKVENFSFQAPYFSEIQHVRKMRFKNLDGEVRHLWGPAGMCRLPSAECTLTRAVHRAHKLEHTFLLVFRLFLLFLATALNFLEEKKLVCMFRWLLQKTCFHAVCQDVE